MSECLVTGVVEDLSGNILANAEIQFWRQTDIFLYDGTVRRPDVVYERTDGSGAISVNLIPGNYRVVFFTNQGQRAFRIAVPELATAFLGDIMAPSAAEIVAISPLVVQAQEAASEAEAAAAAAVAAAEQVVGFATRAAFVSANTATPGLGLSDGQVFVAGGYEYRRSVAATTISDLPGWVPNGEVTPQHFGAVEGAANNSVAIEAAAAYAGKVSVPTPLNYPSAVTVPSGAYEGPESLVVDGRKAARYRSTVKTEPTRSTAHTFIGTAFDGDYSKVPFPIEHYILGATTLGQPTTGYLYTPEATPHYTYMLNQAGHNQSTTGNDGRTGATAYRTRIQHSGDGDAVAYNASVFVSGAKAGASGSTGWLANPAGVLLNGEVIAGNNGVYLNNLEINLDGGVYDVAGVGCVFNFYRNNATGALGAGWDGIRFQSNGSQPIDCGIRFSGSAGFGVGVNFVQMVSTNSAAIAMAAGQRIYLDAEKPGGGNLFDVTLNDTHISVPTLGGALVFTVNNNPVLQLATAVSQRTQVLSSVDVRPLAESSQSFRLFGNGTQQFLGAGQIGSISYIEAGTTSTASTLFSVRTANAGVVSDSFVVNSTGSVNLPQVGARYRVNGTDVIGPRRTGWTAPTGTATRTTFDTATVTTAQLAERVKGLIDDLITHGLIGA